jgi:uncharacterized integral membrane protein
MTSLPSGGGRHSSDRPPRVNESREVPGQHVVRRTRIGGWWVASALFAVVLLLLLIFILENSQRVDISFFGAHGHLPLGVALLLAAVLGILLVVIPGTARIVQLRMVARRHRRIDARGSAGNQQVTAAEPVPDQAAPGAAGTAVTGTAAAGPAATGPAAAGGTGPGGPVPASSDEPVQ